MAIVVEEAGESRALDWRRDCGAAEADRSAFFSASEITRLERRRLETTESKLLLKNEAQLFFNIAWPSVVIQLCQFGLWFENAMFMGRVRGPEELAAVSLANLAGNLSGLSIVFGLLTSVETLAPQAMGAGRKAEVGIICVRGFAVCMVCCGPIFLIWFHMEALLIAVGQPPEVCRQAQRFLRVYCLALPALMYTETSRRFLQCQNIVKPFVWIMGFVCFFAHPFFLWACYTMGFGFDGVAISVSASMWLIALLTAAHIKYNTPERFGPGSKALWLKMFDNVHDEETLQPLTLAMIQGALRWGDVKTFLKLGLPGILGMSEWWFWEATAFMAGRLGTIPLAAHSVAYNVIPMCFMIPLGVSFGISTRAGTLLGNGQVGMAQRLSKWTIGGGTCIVMLNSLLVYRCRGFLIRLFTEDPAVISNAEHIWGFMAVFLVLDGLYGIQRGAILALGLQLQSAGAIVLALWCTGLPLMYKFAIADSGGLVGIWQAMPICYTLLNILFGALLVCTSWKTVSDKIRSDSKEAHKSSLVEALLDSEP